MDNVPVPGCNFMRCSSSGEREAGIITKTTAKYTTRSSAPNFESHTEIKCHVGTRFGESGDNDFIKSENLVSNPSISSVGRADGDVCDNSSDSSRSSHCSMSMATLLPSLEDSVAEDLNSDAAYFALRQRIVAAESCCFCARVLEAIQPRLEPLLPPGQRQSLLGFVSVYAQIARQLQQLIYSSMASRVVHAQALSTIIQEHPWDVKVVNGDCHDWVVDQVFFVNTCRFPCLCSLHSPDMTTQIQHCKNIDDFLLGAGVEGWLSDEARARVWVALAQGCYDGIMDGFSRARR
jgi:hypothetical protein